MPCIWNTYILNVYRVGWIGLAVMMQIYRRVSITAVVVSRWTSRRKGRRSAAALVQQSRGMINNCQGSGGDTGGPGLEKSANRNVKYRLPGLASHQGGHERGRVSPTPISVTTFPGIAMTTTTSTSLHGPCGGEIRCGQGAKLLRTGTQRQGGNWRACKVAVGIVDGEIG